MTTWVQKLDQKEFSELIERNGFDDFHESRCMDAYFVIILIMPIAIGLGIYAYLQHLV